jgi:hypothetical protein
MGCIRTNATLRRLVFGAAAALLASGCALEKGAWRLGEDLSELRFDPISEDVGVHPDTSILDDPGNPFADSLDPNGELKWEVSSSGCDRAVYSWATALALQPTGEHQFYTASCMQALYECVRVDDDDLYLVWTLAKRGYEQVLESFPEDVTYDPTGTVAYELAPLAEAALVSLGAVPADAENPFDDGEEEEE